MRGHERQVASRGGPVRRGHAVFDLAVGRQIARPGDGRSRVRDVRDLHRREFGHGVGDVHGHRLGVEGIAKVVVRDGAHGIRAVGHQAGVPVHLAGAGRDRLSDVLAADLELEVDETFTISRGGKLLDAAHHHPLRQRGQRQVRAESGCAKARCCQGDEDTDERAGAGREGRTKDAIDAEHDFHQSVGRLQGFRPAGRERLVDAQGKCRASLLMPAVVV